MASLNWLELPSHIHALVMNKLASITDYIHFGVVCRSWHYVFDHYIQLEKIPRPQLPLLLIPSSSSSTSPPSSIDDDHTKEEDNAAEDEKGSICNVSPEKASLQQLIIDDKEEEDKAEEKRNLYSVSQRKVHYVGIKLAYNRHCRGSSHGWLVTVEENTEFSVRLFNPFLSVNNEIQLPPLTTFYVDDDPVCDYMFFEKAILSKDPISSSSSSSSSNTKVDNEDDLVVVAIFGQRYRLAFCKPGDKSWTCLPYELLTGLADVTFYKGMLYTVAWRGEIVAFDIHAFITSTRVDHASHYDHDQYLTPKGVFRTVAPPPLNTHWGWPKYIVESSGDLLQVQRFYGYDEDDRKYTIKFQVFKLLDEPKEKCNWEEVKSLQGHSLFLGDNASMSLSATEFSGCKPNCIFFTDNYTDKCYTEHGTDDFGVFNLEDGSIEQPYPVKSKTLIWPPPIWVQPTLKH